MIRKDALQNTSSTTFDNISIILASSLSPHHELSTRNEHKLNASIGKDNCRAVYNIVGICRECSCNNQDQGNNLNPTRYSFAHEVPKLLLALSPFPRLDLP